MQYIGFNEKMLKKKPVILYITILQYSLHLVIYENLLRTSCHDSRIFFIEIELRILLCVFLFFVKKEGKKQRGKKAKKRVLPQLSPY